MKKAYLNLTVFITGGAILVVEILGARIISPYFGSSLYVWSSLITVTLVALAVGYRRGGVVADQSPDGDRLYQIILESAAYLAFVPVIKGYVVYWTLPLDLRVGALLSATALFFVPLTFLSMVTPYAGRLAVERMEDVGKAMGNIYAASTVGSLIGAILTGFVLIPIFHVDKILYMLSMVLAGLTLAPWLKQGNKMKIAAAVILMLFCMLSLSYNRQLAQASGLKVIYSAGSPYGEVRVVESNYGRSLMLSGIVQGQSDRSGRPATKYPYFMEGLARRYNPGANKALVLGLGMGSLPGILMEKGISVDVVEIDPVVADAAKRFFGFNDSAARLYIGDGRYYVENALPNSYDAIFLDIFASEVIPYHLFSMESFRGMGRILRKEGLFLINFHDYSDNSEAVSSQSILKTLRTVFPDVVVFETEPWHGGRYRNITFLASKERLTMEGSGVKPLDMGTEKGVVLSDGYNPIEIFYAPVAAIHREKTRKAYPLDILG